MASPLESIDWKSLGVFTETTSFNELLAVYIVATIGFAVFYIMNKLFFDSIIKLFISEKSPYHELNEKSKKEYYSRNVADLHALIAAPLSIYVCFFACDDPE